MLVIVGSRDLWVTPEIISVVLGKILATDPIDALGVRVPRGSEEPTSMLEQFVAKIGPDLGRVISRHRARTNKREDVYHRDWNMVQNARQVIAFFAPDQEMEGGTGHVVQSALARGIPIEAYRINDNGSPELLGSDDGAWGHPVSGPGGVNGTLYGKYATGGSLIPNSFTINPITSSGTSLNDIYTGWINSGSVTFTPKP